MATKLPIALETTSQSILTALNNGTGKSSCIKSIQRGMYQCLPFADESSSSCLNWRWTGNNDHTPTQYYSEEITISKIDPNKTICRMFPSYQYESHTIYGVYDEYAQHIYCEFDYQFPTQTSLRFIYRQTNNSTYRHPYNVTIAWEIIEFY